MTASSASAGIPAAGLLRRAGMLIRPPSLLIAALLPAAFLHCDSAVAQISDAAPSGVVLGDQSAEFPIVIAHRGASGYLPEHTQEAAVLAHAMRADYIEQDCVLTSDGVAVVLHDMVLDHVSDAAERFPERSRDDDHWYANDFTLAELRQLRIHERSGPRLPWPDSGTRFPQRRGSFRISTLAEHIQLIEGLNQSTGHRAGLYVELKQPAAHRERQLDLTQAVLRILTEHGYDAADSPVFVQCFSLAELQRIRNELGCRLPLVWLASQAPTQQELQTAAATCDGLGISLSALVRGPGSAEDRQLSDIVERAHALGLQVHVWTLRTDALPSWARQTNDVIDRLVTEAGVDGIFTDQPDSVVKWRSEQRQDGNAARQFRLLKSREGDAAGQRQPISDRQSAANGD